MMGAASWRHARRYLGVPRNHSRVDFAFAAAEETELRKSYGTDRARRFQGENPAGSRPLSWKSTCTSNRGLCPLWSSMACFRGGLGRGPAAV